jgi:hypothetical protein
VEGRWVIAYDDYNAPYVGGGRSERLINASVWSYLVRFSTTSAVVGHIEDKAFVGELRRQITELRTG